MTTVAQLIEHLKTLPQEAIVEVGYEKTKSYSTYVEFGPVDTNCTVEFTSGGTGYVHLQAK